MPEKGQQKSGKMATSASTTQRVQHLLREKKLGAPDADGRLLEVVHARFRVLAHQMLRRFDRIRHMNDTDDVLQNTLIRLSNVLKSFHPESPQAFFAVSAKHMRWVLADLARTYGRESQARVLQNGEISDIEPRLPRESAEPLSLDDWAQFHTTVESLTEQEKEIVSLLYYQGITQEAAAEMLGISLRSVKLRWQSAKLNLSCAVNENNK